ncbi:MAG: NifB/NifX family molybdenum-iron cluster-binding protein [Desulfuromonas sp.]|nr:NifB/NifX family molybdenum-iron cluster-binding protein [Desulfuromonas sp.]
MSNNQADIIIAIPCYTDRVLPRFDQAHKFLLANVDLHNKQVNSQTVLTSPVDVHGLARWLAEQEVSGVICSGIHQQQQIELQKLGIWLTWGVAGNLQTVLQHWLQDQQVMLRTS